MRRISFAIAVSALLALAQQYGCTQTQDAARGVFVSGTAEIRVAPDIAHVTLGVRTRAGEANQAASQNAASMRSVTQAIRRLGIADADVETVQYTLQPVFDYPTNAPPRLIDYEATNLVRVTVRDLGKVGRVIDAAVGAGANVVQDVAFVLDKESEVRSRAISQAVADARNKASVMADALGIRLGPLLSASESVGPIIFPRVALAESAGAAETPISPRQIEVRATVNLVYAIM